MECFLRVCALGGHRDSVSLNARVSHRGGATTPILISDGAETEG